MNVSSQAIQVPHGMTPPAQFTEMPPSTWIVSITLRSLPTTTFVLPATKRGFLS